MEKEKTSLDYDISTLEAEYIQLKRKLYKKFFFVSINISFFLIFSVRNDNAYTQWCQ